MGSTNVTGLVDLGMKDILEEAEALLHKSLTSELRSAEDHLTYGSIGE